jgi:hypothetical protein
VKANSKFFRKIGALKVYGDVARYYLSLAQFIVLIIVSGYILPNEIRYLNERNPATMQLLKNTGDGKIEY